MDRPIEMFLSYAHEDEELMNDVRRQLVGYDRRNVIRKYFDRMIPAGKQWKDAIDADLRRADVILLVISPYFLESDYCYDTEMPEALRRHDNGDARVIPIILTTCLWQEEPFGKLQALPRDAKPLDTWPNRNEGAANVAEGIMRVVKELIQASADESRPSRSKKRPKKAPKFPHQTEVENIPLDVSIVCHLPRIAGWASEGDIATKLVAPNTSTLDDVRVYITTRREFTYVHTNFIKDQAEYPTKILTSAKHSLENLLANAVFESRGEAVGSRYAAFCDAMLNSFNYFIDYRALGPTVAHLSFHDPRHVAVVTSDGSVPTLEPLETWKARQAKQSSSVAVLVPPNPWASGSFYLFSFLAIIASLYLMSRDVNLWILPMLLSGAILAATIIGAFTLKNIGELSDKSFLALMRMALASLPLLRSLAPRVRASSSHAILASSAVSPLPSLSSRYQVGRRFRFAFGGTCRVTSVERSEDGREYFTVGFDGDPERTLTFPLEQDPFTEFFLTPL